MRRLAFKIVKILKGRSVETMIKKEHKHYTERYKEFKKNISLKI